jgi:hypothetical protein
MKKHQCHLSVSYLGKTILQSIDYNGRASAPNTTSRYEPNRDGRCDCQLCLIYWARSLCGEDMKFCNHLGYMVCMFDNNGGVGIGYYDSDVLLWDSIMVHCTLYIHVHVYVMS